MKRYIENYLEKWKKDSRRKPIVLRGARQVGKTYVARKFGQSFDQCVEINFEKHPEAAKIFDFDLDIKRIVRDLSIFCKSKIEVGTTLLFFDEIQVAPKAISALRYFYEDLPDLHVIAAGSLIDFKLEEISVPVGRLTYLFLSPVSFREFLIETESKLLVDTLNDISQLKNQVAPAYHERMLKRLSEYLAIGGMPGVMNLWLETGDLEACRSEQLRIINSYRDDFGKYAKKNQLKYIGEVFDSISHLLGEKVKFSKISEHYKSRELAPCLDLLVQAGVVHKVYQSSSQLPPLGAKVNKKYFKAIFLDIGLSQALLGLDIGSWILNPKSTLENKGHIVEAFVGQELMAYGNPEERKPLYYWHRDKGASKAEIDYVVQKGEQLIGIEVKSGATGHCKSLVSYIKHTQGCDKGICFSQHSYKQKELYSIIPLYQVSLAV